MNPELPHHLAARTLCVVALLAASPARAQGFRDLIDTQSGRDAPPAPPAPPPTLLPDAPAPRFGARGEVVFSGAAVGSIYYRTYGADSPARSLRAAFGPGVDVFVVDNVSVGLALGASYARSDSYATDGSLVRTTLTSFSAGPRLGYLLSLSDRVSIWPTAELAIGTTKLERRALSGRSLSTGTSPIGAPDARWAGPTLALQAPLVFLLRPHFFLGFGPTYTHDFARAIPSDAAASGGGSEESVYGAALVVGGFFGGPDVPDPAPQAPADANARRRRFGDAGAVVLTNDIGAGYTAARYSSGGASWSSFLFQPGFDAFVLDNVTLGLTFRLVDTKSTGLSSSGAPVTTTSSGQALGARAGLAIPASSFVSVWIRFGFQIGEEQRSIEGEDAPAQPGQPSSKTTAASWQYTVSLATASIGVPVLLHVAPHLFVGFGPYASTDVSGSTDRGRDLRSSVIGAGGILGGWM